ncbi:MULTISPECIES: DUF3021 domain-containing protein [unclassified Staphylococcus]|uniref:DUF3021 domain-containing protein n=1 Tax=unclassified Staphylococcus TaxID=91994 RepID=UPI0021D1D4E7|nr:MULTISPECIES: DUF3021 domain-containing protein [unclassified Staphylococcus]UXR76417.1 DUF3021 domain-containing protein [Staphylococcus sp. IVB6233]UXR80544.1 DUF3021 domain-containing protein [Staphylococcus sp. IVB6218]
MKKMIKSMLMAIGIGSSITLFVIAIYNIQMSIQDVFGLYVIWAVCGFLPIVYQNERMPLALQLLIHFSGSIIAFFIISTLNDWVPLKVGALVGAFLVFTVAFLIIWFVFFMMNMRQSKMINTKLKNK